ncbi:MAG TPA: dienelactone hydrolase family protein [Acidimicrobiia bacterium]
MQRVSIYLAVLGLVATGCSDLEPISESVTEVIEIESVDLPGTLWEPLMPPLSAGSAVTVEGTLTLPPTDVPVPAVILVHGCGGVGGSERGWVPDLRDEGYASLLLDSFGGRGLTEICTGAETLNVASPIVDLFRATEVLRDHPYIDGNRIGVIGFSFGGRTALWSAMTRFREAYEGAELAVHVAFYPSTCFIRLQGETEVSEAPIRILHGSEDDWTPIDQCQEFIARMSSSGADAELIAYPGAHHGFDNETLPPSGTVPLEAVSPRNCQFEEIDGSIIDPDTGAVAGVGSPCVEVGVQVGYNRDAHMAAEADLFQLLAEVFG